MTATDDAIRADVLASLLAEALEHIRELAEREADGYGFEPLPSTQELIDRIEVALA